MKADGVIIMTDSADTGKVLKACQVPVVLVDRTLQNVNEKAVVKSDHYKGGYLAAEHLVQCGCKKIVCLKEPSGYSSGNERYRGYLAVCEKYGLKEQSVDCTYVYEEGIRAVGKMLEQYPDVDGVIAGNDMIAMAVYKELTRMGKKIPQEVQLIGFDDVKFGQIFTPELTTIHQSIREMGTAAAQIIEKCVEGQPCQKKNIFDVSLVVRETTMEW